MSKKYDMRSPVKKPQVTQPFRVWINKRYYGTFQALDAWQAESIARRRYGADKVIHTIKITEKDTDQ